MALTKTQKLSAKPHFKPQTKRLMDQAREVLEWLLVFDGVISYAGS